MRVSAIRFWWAPITIAALLSSAGSARAWDAKYQCDLPMCQSPCVNDEGSCEQPVECQLVDEDDPGYDGCSVPKGVLETGGFGINPILWSHAVEWSVRFAHSDGDDAPCFVHDQCYRMGTMTYGHDRSYCDKEFRDRMVAQCLDDIPWFFFVGRLACLRAAQVFYGAVSGGGQKAYDEKQQTCCDYAHEPGAMTATCAGAYGAQQGDPPAPPPIPGECVGLEGQCRGGGCAPVDAYGATYGELVDPLSEFHPNGDFLPEWRCDETMGLVCNEIAGEGRCQECGIDTMIGCGCSDDDSCADAGEQGLKCRGGVNEGWSGAPGRCWPVDDVPEWQCANNCAVLSDPYSEAYYCQHTGASAGQCLSAEFGEPAATSCYPFVPTASVGDYDCEHQCSDDEPCTSHGWPLGTQCVGGRCVL